MKIAGEKLSGDAGAKLKGGKYGQKKNKSTIKKKIMQPVKVEQEKLKESTERIGSIQGVGRLNKDRKR